MQIKCPRCNNTQNYKIRDPDKIPLRPKTQCKHCRCWIYINKELINNKKLTKKIGQRKNVRPKIKNLEKTKTFLVNTKILKMLDEGLYAKQIADMTNFSNKILSQTINGLKRKNLIKQVNKKPKIPKFYQLTTKGQLTLKKDFSLNDQKKEEIEKKEIELKPCGIDKCRVHAVRFKNDLIQRASWLYKIKTRGIVRGLRVKKINLKNWSKFIIYFNNSDFNGIEKIEINTQTIVYNFKLNKSEQYVYQNESLKNYLNDKINDCKRARTFLQQKGFSIDNKDPEPCGGPHYGFESHGDPTSLGSLGQYLNFSVNSDSVDDSSNNGGEEETTDQVKAQSVLDIPRSISEMKNSIVEMATQMKTMADAITTMVQSLNPSPKTNLDNHNQNNRGLFI